LKTNRSEIETESTPNEAKLFILRHCWQFKKPTHVWLNDSIAQSKHSIIIEENNINRQTFNYDWRNCMSLSVK